MMKYLASLLNRWPGLPTQQMLFLAIGGWFLLCLFTVKHSPYYNVMLDLIMFLPFIVLVLRDRVPIEMAGIKEILLQALLMPFIAAVVTSSVYDLYLVSITGEYTGFALALDVIIALGFPLLLGQWLNAYHYSKEFTEWEED